MKILLYVRSLSLWNRYDLQGPNTLKILFDIDHAHLRINLPHMYLINLVLKFIFFDYIAYTATGTIR